MSRALRLAAQVAGVLLAFASTSARASDTDRSWVVLKEAQAAHDEGVALRRTDPAASLAAFRRCVAAWERLRAAGAENGALEFNLGNAYLETGDLGRAITAYLRAERFMPGNADLDRNLAHARSLAAANSVGGASTLLVDSVARWWHLVPLGARTAIGWTCWVGFWALVALRVLRRDDRRPVPAPWRIATWLALVGWVAFGGSVVADELRWRTRPAAVVVDADVVLRKGNGEGYEPAIVEALGPGAEARLLEARPGWLRIGLPDGRTGWVREAQVTVP